MADAGLSLHTTDLSELLPRAIIIIYNGGHKMVSFTNLALQTKIGLIVLTGLVVTSGLFGFLGIQSMNDSTSMILDQRLDAARILANNIDENMRHTLAHLQDTARLNFIPGELEFAALTGPLLDGRGVNGGSDQYTVFIAKNGTA